MPAAAAAAAAAALASFSFIFLNSSRFFLRISAYSLSRYSCSKTNGGQL